MLQGRRKFYVASSCIPRINLRMRIPRAGTTIRVQFPAYAVTLNTEQGQWLHRLEIAMLPPAPPPTQVALAEHTCTWLGRCGPRTCKV